MSEKVGWLIERYYNGDLKYWSGRPRDPVHSFDRSAWTKDASLAIWFADNDSASVVLAWCLEHNIAPYKPAAISGGGR